MNLNWRLNKERRLRVSEKEENGGDGVRETRIGALTYVPVSYGNKNANLRLDSSETDRKVCSFRNTYEGVNGGRDM